MYDERLTIQDVKEKGWPAGKNSKGVPYWRKNDEVKHVKETEMSSVFLKIKAYVDNGVFVCEAVDYPISATGKTSFEALRNLRKKIEDLIVKALDAVE